VPGTGRHRARLTQVHRRIDERLRRLEQVKALIDETPHDPVLRGTDVPVHVVAGLGRRQGTTEIIDDYPVLTAEDVEAAVEYAKVYPRAGRPLPTRSSSVCWATSPRQSFGTWRTPLPRPSHNPSRDVLVAGRDRAGRTPSRRKCARRDRPRVNRDAAGRQCQQGNRLLQTVVPSHRNNCAPRRTGHRPLANQHCPRSMQG
jgi:hypothetical protein